ncbi:hypothetical protein [uncultured Roseibium sp.]|uniref:hypothetical protein n=1 Tax=uncultured Roseibium sp. TaxID=1936171 RepID=UPI002618F26E|nr:hypothetical protein [uncultured Roseibium sp.]
MNTSVTRIASYDAISWYSHWIIADAMIGMKPSGQGSILRSLESSAHCHDRIFLS